MNDHGNRDERGDLLPESLCCLASLNYYSANLTTPGTTIQSLRKDALLTWDLAPGCYQAAWTLLYFIQLPITSQDFKRTWL